MKVNLSSFGVPLSPEQESQDAFAVQAWNNQIIGVIADGVGNSQGAREAADKLVKSIIDHFQSRPANWSVSKSLEEFTRLLNRALYQESVVRFQSPEMLSTLAIVVVDGDRLYGLNVGDSRVYLLQKSRLLQLSQDHRESDPQMSHALTRAMGMEPDVVPHFFEHSLAAGDVVLLCTDGVYQVLPDAELAALLSTRVGARSVIAEARQKVTPETLDDMSAVIIDLQEIAKAKNSHQSQLEVPGPLHRGDVFEGYKLDETLQQNDRTWIATRAGRRVVLKFAPLAARDSEEIMNHFVREMWNVTRIKADFFPQASIPEDSRYCYYVMELIEAPTLRQYLRSARLNTTDACALGRFLLKVGQYLLQFDLIHGDIKPENILVQKNGPELAFRLVDFGSMNEVFSVTSRAGTPSYLAPERFQGAANCEQTELFSIGVTLYEALTGKLPYGEIEPFQSPVFRSARAPSKSNAHIPDWLDAVVLRSITTHANGRYRHYSEMLFEIENPERVEPYFRPNAPLLERNPLLFYKAAFVVMLLLNIYLLSRLFHSH